MSQRGRGLVPISDARSIGERRGLPLVVVFAIHQPPDNRFTVTTWGRTMKLCKLAADYGEKLMKSIESGEVVPAQVEPPDSMLKRIWLRVCPYCKEDTFGELGTPVDDLCSVCSQDISDVPIREDYIADVVSEVVKKEDSAE